jgi:integrase/recombinase XerC
MHQITPVSHNLQRSFDATIGSSFDTSVTPDVLQQLLSDKRSVNTRRAYEKDVSQFFRFMTGKEVTPDLVLEFLHLERTQAISVVLKYKALLIQQGLKEATVNRRLAAIKSLVAMGRKLGVCSYGLEDIKGERVQQYRDTSGVDAQTFQKVLGKCDRDTLSGKRDYGVKTRYAQNLSRCKVL